MAEPMKATYVKKLVPAKLAKLHADLPGYVHLDTTDSGAVYGFTWVKDDAISHHLYECTGAEWDKCHAKLSSDKQCHHNKWHEPQCHHISEESAGCTCQWKSCLSTYLAEKSIASITTGGDTTTLNKLIATEQQEKPVEKSSQKEGE